MEVIKTAGNVLTIKNQIDKGYEQLFLLLSDIHFDSKECERKLLKKHLDEAKEFNAGILTFGDFFDAMQGKNDRRGLKTMLKERDITGGYFNNLIDEASEFFEPYKQNLLLLGYGNHELSVLKHSDFDLVRELGRRLEISSGGFAGFVRFIFIMGKRSEGSYNLYYTHGSGGGGTMSMDILNHKRMSIWLGNADIVVSGHTHDTWVYKQTMRYVSIRGQLYDKPQYHIKIPTYKNETLPGDFGFLVEQGSPPKPLGGYWLKFYYDSTNTIAGNRIKYKIYETD